MKDYYMMLDVSLDADTDAITKAYKKKALELHPDKNQDDPYYTAKFQEIQEAYSVLSDSTLRHDYDEQYRSRIDFTINRVENHSSLPDEKLPDYIHGVYEMEIREYHKDLARLYAEVEVIDEYVYKSYALGLFRMITDRAPSFDNYLDEIKHFRDPNTLKDAFFNPLSFIHPSAEREAFYQKYIEYLIANYHGELSVNQLTIRCIFTRGEISSKEKRIITFEYIVMVLHYSSFLHELNKPTEVINNSPIAQVLREISPLIHSRGIEYMKEGGIWKPIIGALALGNDDAHKELMQKLKEDKIEDKIDNIQIITKLAELACQSEDYSQDNMFGFAYTIRQLNDYTSN